MKSIHNIKKGPFVFKNKKMFLLLIFALYLLIGLILIILVKVDIIIKNPVYLDKSVKPLETLKDDVLLTNSSIRLDLAKKFINKNMVKSSGHVDLYYGKEDLDKKELGDLKKGQTNSEAMSYYLLWNANDLNKRDFDKALSFIEENMIHPEWGYLMWRLEENDMAIGDGINMASDADLRTIKALLIAERQWKDKRYSETIDLLSGALENVAVTKSFYLSPYGGIDSGGKIWNTEESWISYSDFTVFNDLSLRHKGNIWNIINQKMKVAVIGSQLSIGLFNTQLTEEGLFKNDLDGGGYSINSLWVMVRSAESEDRDLMESSKDALEFYKKEFYKNGIIFDSYTSSGEAKIKSDSTWVYSIIARTALELGDYEFANKLIEKLLEKQIMDEDSEFYGSFPENPSDPKIVTQYTMQETILTLQEFTYLQSDSYLLPE